MLSGDSPVSHLWGPQSCCQAICAVLMGFPLKLYVEILMRKHQKGDGLGQRHALGAEVGAACTSQLATPSQVALGGRNSFFGEKKAIPMASRSGTQPGMEDSPMSPSDTGG